MGNIISHLTATVRNFAGAGRASLDVSIVDGSGNQITTFGGSGGTSAVDEAGFTAGAGQGTPAMGLFESAPSTLANGQIGVMGLTNDRKVKVSGSFSSAPITSGTAAHSNVAAANADTSLLASNASRLNFSLFNDATTTCWIKFAAGASKTSFVVELLPGQKFSTSDLGVNWTGAINGFWDSGVTGNMRVLELTA